jgi:hypothetical protein
MTITWSEAITLTDRIDYPDLLSGSGLAIWVSSAVTPVWNKIGYYQLEALIEGEFLKLQPERLEFGKSLIKVPYRFYKLSIISIPNVLTIYPFISIKIAQIEREIMGINYSQIEKATGSIVDTSVAGAVATFQILGVDILRHEGTIYNRTNRTLYVKWGTAAATAADLAVPAGSNIDIPEDYTGAVQGICAAGVTGNVLSQTISFV